VKAEQAMRAQALGSVGKQRETNARFIRETAF